MKRLVYSKAINGIIRDYGGTSRRLLGNGYLIGQFNYDGRTFGYWIDIASRAQEITLGRFRAFGRLHDSDTALDARRRIIESCNQLIRADNK